MLQHLRRRPEGLHFLSPEGLTVGLGLVLPYLDLLLPLGCGYYGNYLFKTQKGFTSEIGLGGFPAVGLAVSNKSL